MNQVNDLENLDLPEANYEISGDAFIGYKVGNHWILYLYEAKMQVGYISYLKAENRMIEFFEGENYSSKHFVYTYDNEIKEEKRVGVSIGSSEFWTSKLWNKQLEIEDVYPFEIRRSNIGTEKVKSINELLQEVDQRIVN